MKKVSAILRRGAAVLTTAAMLTVVVPAFAVSDGADAEDENSEVTLQSDTGTLLPYQNMSLSFEERAADLVARMTLEEKAAQTAAKNTPAINRLGVHSYYYWREGIHGVARQGKATSFPSSLAMSNTWDRQLMYEVMDITSTEARGKNNRYDLNYWNPTINMARDPRWGRNEETYGEDPYLTSQIGGSAIKGMQGTDEKYIKTMATLKHYAANNCEGERQTGTSVMNENTLREYYTRAFRDIIEDYGPSAVMSSYNATTLYRGGELLSAMNGQKIDYIASSANSYLLNDVLKRTYGFGGFIVGDCGAWDNAYGRQSLRNMLYPDLPLDNITAPMTAAKIIEAGSSLDCNNGSNGSGQVAAAVEQGLISEDALDIVVYELFLQRMRTGEFDEGAKYQDITSSVIETDKHVAKAEEAAEKTWVLLKNDGTLPIKGEKEAKASLLSVDTENLYEITKAEFTGDNTLSVSYVKSDDAHTGTLIAAAYENGALAACVSAGIDGSGNQILTIAKPENGVVKTFIWDSLAGMKPLCKVKTIIAGEPATTDAPAVTSTPVVTTAPVVTDVPETKPTAKPETKPVTVAVVGDHANELVLGDYSGEPTKVTTPYEGIVNAVKAQNSASTVELLGNVSDDTPLFNIKSITLVKSTGKNKTLDLSAATSVNGMEKFGSELKNITKTGTACIKDVDFKDVTEIKIEAASLTGMPTVSVSVCYESLSQPAGTVNIASTDSEKTYGVNTGTYDGATGGYNSTADLYIKINASAEFSVENYKASLDKADYIIAYGGTTTADSSESNDRKSIDLPATESHVGELCSSYPEKTVVVLQTVGQVNLEGIKDKCAALLWTSYNGQMQGEALGRILTGEVNPSGKLSTTWYDKADLDKMPIGSAKTKVDGIDYNYTNYELTQDIHNVSADYPGRTYQYYTKTPVYPFGYGESYTDFEYSNITIDKTNADANDTVTISADVKNSGSVGGTEVAQLYISVPGADGKKLPLKQLKGFERVELKAGEKKTVSFKINLSDVFFFDETEQKNYVVTGEYTAKVGGSSADEDAQEIKFNVSGDISDELKHAYAIPSGLKVYGAKDSVGTVTPAAKVSSGLSVTLKNDKVITDFAANGITVTYASADTDIAAVDANGNITVGTKEGVTTITATAIKGESAVTTSFPIVSQFKDKISDSAKNAYLTRLEAVYEKCPEVAYTSDNWQKLSEVYTKTKDAVLEALLDDGLELLVSTAINDMTAIPKISLSEAYTVVSENPAAVMEDRIEYSTGGIGTYTASETSISGTVTRDNPAIINMQALSGTDKVTGSLIWTLERLDSSSRKEAEIDTSTGALKLYENGIYKITASDYTNNKCGTLIVYANLQIEGESADDGDGANVADSETAASGGFCAGSTEARWLRFDGVKLSRLKDITFRVSQKDSPSVINVSLRPNADWIIASAQAPATGDWNKWAEVSANIDRSDLNWLTFDENGCGTIYVQTNKANLDYMKLGYDNSAIDAYCLSNGKIGVNVSADEGALKASVGGAEKASVVLTDTENYTLGSFTSGDVVTLTVYDSANQPVGESVNLTYTPAKAKDMLVYNFSDSVFDSFFDSAEGTSLTSGLGMDGEGGWNTDKGGSYTYNGRTYTFTRSFKGGNGKEGARRVFFTPDSDGAVTAFFKASSDRCMYIQQGDNVVEKFGNGSICEVQLNVKAGERVYVYGGGSNKNLYGVVFESNKAVAQATPTPAPSPTPTPEPLPELGATVTIEAENYTKTWPVPEAKRLSTTAVTGASGGKVLDNTKNNDIVYFGEKKLDGLAAIDVVVGTKETGDKAEFFAVDMTGIDVSSKPQSDINALLTSTNSLGSITLTPGSGWNDFKEYRIRVNTDKTGNYGLFVRFTAGEKYCGNYDCIKLLYAAESAQTLSAYEDGELLAAENDTTLLSIRGDIITAVNKNSGETTSISYSGEYGENVSFKKLINNRGMFTALAKSEDGKTRLITSPMGGVWIDATPDCYAEADEGAPGAPVINDFIPVNDQLYLGCDGGWLITMTSCTKCTTIKKVCDFDIKSIDWADGYLEFSDGKNHTEISISDARQGNIKYDAAMELAGKDALLVDVRSTEEFESGSLDGAINVPVDSFEAWLEVQNKDSVIIVFCASGVRSKKAADAALARGFNSVYVLTDAL